MRLISADGAEIEIRPTGYQFPANSTPEDWDANWLIIEGAGRLASGETWTFRHPCLTTWEASSLADWLRQVADGVVQPSTFPSEDHGRLMDFTEPNFAFSLAARSLDRLTIRVHFSLESLPPWLADDEAEDIVSAFIALDLSEAELRGALQVWVSDLMAFPAR